MKLPLNSSQTIAVVAVAAALLGGAYAIGRSSAPAPAAAPVEDSAPMAKQDLTPKQPTRVARAEPEPAPRAVADAQPTAKGMCNECSRVVSVRSVEREGKGSGLGAVGGAVIGGLLGNQVGGGNGKKIATVGGAVAGGFAGNEIEKRSKSTRVWIVELEHNDGSTQRKELGHDPQLRSGDIVVVRDGRIERQR